MSFSEFLESPAYKKIMGKVYGLGAAVVILGALWKILHLPGASFMLIAGLGTEAIIFGLSAFEPPHEMPDWSLVYPELVGLEVEGDRHGSRHGGGGSDLAALIEGGHLEPEVVEKLSEGIKKLAMTSNQLSDLSNASIATETYLSNMKQAGDAVGHLATVQTKSAQSLDNSVELLSTSYSQAASAIKDSGKDFVDNVNKSGQQLSTTYDAVSQSISQQFDRIVKTNSSYNEKLGDVTKNLSAVNTAYELQLQGLNTQVQISQELNVGLAEVKDQIIGSAGDSKTYKDQVSKLSQTVSELNTIYGNMLSAMNMGNR
ncbi:MAG: gliding motility protein GldL [Marinilabiliaceae bacterium]|nr:gliding motility protein GldL [Marinilabiliaceae bacterium]